MLLSTFSSLTAVLLLSAQLLPVTASIAAVDVMRDITAKDFKALALAASSPHGGRRALLQSTAFSQDFFNILEPILVGNTGEAVCTVATTASDTMCFAQGNSYLAATVVM